MSKGVPRIVMPLAVPRGQPDAPHRAEVELQLSQQTQALAYRSTGTTRQWCWGVGGRLTYGNAVNPAFHAPTARITAVDTWTNFELGLSTLGFAHVLHRLELPWRFSESFADVQMYAVVCTDSEMMLTMRISSETLLDAVAATNGTAGNRAIARDTPSMMLWRNFNWNYPKTYRTAPYQATLRSPTMPANRRVLIVPQIKCVDDNNAMFDLGGEHIVRLVYLALLDTANKDQGIT